MSEWRNETESCGHLKPPLLHLNEVVEVVLPPYPAVVGLETVGFVGDVSGVQALTVVELPFEQLEGQNITKKGREGESHSFQHNQLILRMIKQLIKPILMRNTHSANNCRWGHCILCRNGL